MGPAGSASDTELIARLRKGTVEEDQALRTIYRTCYPTVSGYVLRNSGSTDDARDVFQDGMIVLYRNIKQGRFNGESALGTYLFSICRFLWLKELRRRGRTVDHDALDAVAFEAPADALLNEERRKLMLALFDRVGEACRRILLLSFYEELDMREIAARTGFKDEQNARNKKYKCLQGLKTLMREKGGLSHWMNELREHRTP